jgi:nucleoside-diphosphate-sugar epimerase
MGNSEKDLTIGAEDIVLITGANGFIGSRVVANLLNRGFRRLRCLVRSQRPQTLLRVLEKYGAAADVEIIQGNLLSRSDCEVAANNVAVIYHLAAARGEKSFADAFLNSVVTTRNLLDVVVAQKCLKRFVNVGSFAVYTNTKKPKWRLLDESCAVEKHPELRNDAYAFAKWKQDEIVADYGTAHGLPYVIVRPGYVYGPGSPGITGRIGLDTFGVYLHLGGSNTIPFTYVDNCADAIVLAGLKPGADGEIFNVVDDNLYSSRKFLRLYKKNVKRFRSIYLPHFVSYSLCALWGWYCRHSDDQLPPAFTLNKWHAFWKKTHYSNQKIKTRLGWVPRIDMSEGLKRHFESCRELEQRA